MAASRSRRKPSSPRSGWGKSERFASQTSLRYLVGMNVQSPIVSEFETEEKAAAYRRWLEGKVAASLADPRPGIPHDEVMAEIRAIIAEAKPRKAC